MEVDVATGDELDRTEEVEPDVTPEVNDQDVASVRRRWWHWRPQSNLVSGLVVVAIVTAVFGGMAGWFGYQTLQAHKAKRTHDMLLQVGRQAAIDLTTIDAATVDADVQRVVDVSVDPFAAEFAKKSPGFADAVRQAKSKSEGKVTEAGIESVKGDAADVLVTVAVTTTAGGQQDKQPRLWRMRITVQKSGDTAKVSNVGFVS